MNMESNRVLLIEDNQGDVDLVRLRLLESSSELGVSYDMSSADRLSTGLAELNRERPAVVLLDLYLPDSKGAETFRNVIDHAPDVPIVVLSAQDDEELVLNAVKHGVQDYLVKGTFDGKRLGRTLRCAIERHAILTERDLSWEEQAKLKEHSVTRNFLGALTSIQEAANSMLDDVTTPFTSQHRETLDTILRQATGLYTTLHKLLAIPTAPEKPNVEALGPNSYPQPADS